MTISTRQVQKIQMFNRKDDAPTNRNRNKQKLIKHANKQDEQQRKA